MDNDKKCDVRFFTVNLSNDKSFSATEGNKVVEKLSQAPESLYRTSASGEENNAVGILEHLAVVDCAIGPQCVAFLTKAGHVCRLKVSTNFVDAKKATSNTDDRDPPPDPKGSQLGPNALRIQRSLTSARTNTRTGGSNSSSGGGGIGGLSSGIRLIRTSSTGIRTSSRSMPIIGGRSSMMVSQSQVPENLISQVQNILQGKGRNVIIRELQRSNLDVNTAVNNLLSRDDDDADEVDESGSDYIQCDDLMSWLDGGLVTGEHPRVVIDPDSSIPENLIYSGFSFSGLLHPSSERERSRLIEQIRSRRSKASGRTSGNLSSRSSGGAGGSSGSGGGGGGGSGSSAAAAFDQRGAELESVLVDVSSHSPTWAEETKKANTPGPKSKSSTDEQTCMELSYGETLDWWVNRQGTKLKFEAIASMHTELVAVDSQGNLRQWLWSSDVPYEKDGVYHPRALALGLQDQVITFLAAGEIRASVVTKIGAIASWTDESVSHYSSALDIPCTIFEVLRNERILSLQACSLYSAILTDTNRIFWWGVFPFNQRKKLIEKSQKSLLENVDKDNGGQSSMEITEGMQVCMKNFPIYHAGAVAVNLSDGVPKCGRLLEPVWSLEKKGSFKILKSSRSSKPRAPAVTTQRSPARSRASTRSSSSSFNIDSLLDSNRSSTRKRSADESQQQTQDEASATAGEEVEMAEDSYDDIDEIDEVEQWSVNNLIFIKDIKSAPVGRVMKVDKNLVAVQFTDSYDQRNAADAESMFKQCRLMERNDVVPVKSTAFRVLDCIQKTPKRLIVDQNSKLHTIDANDQGVVAIASSTSSESMVGGLRKYNLGTGRCNSATNFSTSVQSFFASDPELEAVTCSDMTNEFYRAILRHNLPVAGPRFIGNGKRMPLLANPSGRIVLIKISPNLAVDRNGMVYPLQLDENLGIRDPIWFDVPPLLACNMGVHRDPVTKKRCLLMALVFKRQQIMPDIWRRDLRAVNKLLKEVEKSYEDPVTKHFCLMMSREKCDGNRNVLHMCVSVSTTSSNKESKEDEEARNKKQASTPASGEPRRGRARDDDKGDGDVSGGGGSFPGGGGGGASSSDKAPVEMMSNIRSAISDLERRITLPVSGSSRSSTPASSGPSAASESARNRYSSSQADSPMNLMSLFSNTNTFDDYFGESERWGSRMASSSSKDGGGGGGDDPDGPSGGGGSGSRKGRKQKKEVSFSLPTDNTDSSAQQRGTRNDAIEVLRRLCDSEAFRQHLPNLLCEKDSYGHTPFMYAISCRAYPAAQVLLSAIIKLLKSGEISKEKSNKTKSLQEMIYPDHEREDNNPLHMLCSNDVCSFTWTGAQHINQDIFECRTCGLTDSLCCCTECARVCHKGHDCTLKRTSPTAYCDCWEKCPCKSLVSGDQPVRINLLHSLVEHTNLYRLPNGDGEHILRFMVKTLARQKREHSQYRPTTTRGARLSGGSSRARVSRLTTKSPPPDYFTDMPEHDLRPPKFCHKALYELLGNPQVVASLIDHDEVQIALDSPSSSSVLPEDKVLLRQQQGISHLDQFTNTLITQCQGNEHLDQLLNTLVDMTRTSGSKQTSDITPEQGVKYCQRFIRSVIRVYIVMQAQTYPEKIFQRSYVAFNESRRQKCRRAFMALITISIREFCEVAESLIAPVRMGVTRPCQDFVPYNLQMHDVQNTCGQVFNRDPFTPSWLHPGGDDDDDEDRQGPHFSGGGTSRRSRSSRKHKRSGGDDDNDDAMKSGGPLSDSLVQEILQEVHGDGSAAYDSNYESRESDDMDMTCIEETDSNSDSSEFLDMVENARKDGLFKKKPRGSTSKTARRGGDGGGGGGFDPDDDDDEDDEEDGGDDDESEEEGDEGANDDQDQQRRNVRRRTGAATTGAASDSDEYGWQESNNLERAATRKQRLRARQVPHSLEWAMGRNTELSERFTTATSNIANSSNGAAGRSGSGIRGRNDHHLESPYINSLLERHHQDGYKNSKMEEIIQSNSNQSSSTITNDRLARLFGVCVRDISHLVNTLNKDKYPEESEIKNLMEINKQDCHELLSFTRLLLKPTWDWLMRIVDSTEAQLRYGQALSLHTLSNHPDHPNYKGDKGGQRSTKKATDKTNRDELFAVDGMIKQDFLSYALSLMRSHSDEHSATLPVMDVSALRHVAYVLDAYISILRGFTFPSNKKNSKKFSDSHRQHADVGNDGVGSENDEDDDGLFAYSDLSGGFDVENASSTSTPQSSSAQKKQASSSCKTSSMNDEDVMDNLAQPLDSFFQRSNSMSFVAGADSNPFEFRCEQALPLAVKPHLLQLNARKEELFGRPRIESKKSPDDLPKLGLSRRHDSEDSHSADDTSDKSREGSLGHSSGASSSASSATSEQDNEQPTTSKTELKKEVIPSNEDQFKPSSSSSSSSRKKSKKESAAGGDAGEPVRKRTRRRALESPDTAGSSSGKGGAPSRKRAKKGGKESASNKSESSCTKTAKKQHQLATSGLGTEEEKIGGFLDASEPSVDSILSRCRLVLELFCRVFLESVGAEPKSILYELGGFEVREAKFRKEMESTRTGQSDDLLLTVNREREQLIPQTFRQINHHCRRKIGSGVRQPLQVLRVKVTFSNEPGEGTGVARSFYTAIAEALRSTEPLPPLEPLAPPAASRGSAVVLDSGATAPPRGSARDRPSAGGSGGSNEDNDPFPPFLLHRMFRRERRGNSTSGPLSVASAPFYARGRRDQRNAGHFDRNKTAIGERLFPKIEASSALANLPEYIPKVTGMILRLPAYELLLLMRSDRNLQERVTEAIQMLRNSDYTEEGFDDEGSAPGNDDASSRAPREQSEAEPSSAASAAAVTTTTTAGGRKDDDGGDVLTADEETDEAMETDQEIGGKPLFFEPAKGKGFLVPAMYGDTNELRMNAYRNVGRLMGLCLLQNELFPLPLCRHVIKVVLGRKVNWHDLAFYDSVIYDSMRATVKMYEEGSEGDMELSFAMDLQPEEGGGHVELIKDGENMTVNASNVRDYVRRYALYRMVICCRPALEMIRAGVLDVVNRSHLDGLTPEDFRLLINGCGQVDVQTLISYTVFSDEIGKSASATPEKLTEFKRWFWWVVHHLDNSQRQELLFFWTGSPALPASEDGFQPLPSITIRPPSDSHLPTANTCISKLYVPLYSSRHILQQKLLVAIKTKSFGFV